MDEGHFYFLLDSYFTDFPDPYLMKNKESINGSLHDRPCFYAFRDNKTGIIWMIPFSSRTEKFKNIYYHKLQKYGRCDTIVFGKVLGYEKAFLIQNMCPVINKYIGCKYIDRANNNPVKISGVLEKQLIQKANRVLQLQRSGHKVIFPDVLKIENELLKNNS